MDSETKQVLLDLINILIQSETSKADRETDNDNSFCISDKDELEELKDIIQSKGTE